MSIDVSKGLLVTFKRYRGVCALYSVLCKRPPVLPSQGDSKTKTKTE